MVAIRAPWGSTGYALAWGLARWPVADGGAALSLLSLFRSDCCRRWRGVLRSLPSPSSSDSASSAAVGIAGPVTGRGGVNVDPGSVGGPGEDTGPSGLLADLFRSNSTPSAAPSNMPTPAGRLHCVGAALRALRTDGSRASPGRCLRALHSDGSCTVAAASYAVPSSFGIAGPVTGRGGVNVDPVSSGPPRKTRGPAVSLPTFSDPIRRRPRRRQICRARQAPIPPRRRLTRHRPVRLPRRRLRRQIPRSDDRVRAELGLKLKHQASTDRASHRSGIVGEAWLPFLNTYRTMCLAPENLERQC